MSIKVKLIILFLVLSIIPMALISIYSTQKSSVALNESANLYLKAKAEAFAMTVNQQVDGKSNISSLIKRAISSSVADEAKAEQYFEKGFMSLITTSGEVIYHPNEELIGQVLEEDYVLKAIEQKTDFYPFTDGDGEEKISYLSYCEPLDMIMWAIVPETEVLASANSIRNSSLIFGFITVLIVIIIAVFFANSISKPINLLATDITYIAENLDFTTLNLGSMVDRKDEIGLLSRSFSRMVDSWQNALFNVKNVVKNLLESSTQLAEASEDSSAASEEVSASIEEVANRASDQTSYLNEANQAVNDLIAKLNNSSQLGREAFQLANSTLTQAQQGQHSVTNVISQMNNINHVIEEIAQVVSNLVYKSNQIGEIVNLIDSIANQTQLLALNAAIEAARAGEAGRGFSVVADEIKQLAEESMKSANKIKELIKETQDESNKASNAMVIGKKEVQNGSEVVDEAGSIFKKIINASETNLKGTKETTDALDTAIRISDLIIDKVHEVAGIAEETSASAEEVSASTEEQTATMQQVSASASMLKEMAVELERVISEFKLKK